MTAALQTLRTWLLLVVLSFAIALLVDRLVFGFDAPGLFA